MDHFPIRLWHETKSGFYRTTGNDKLSGWTKKKLQNTSQSQTYTKKMSRSLFDCLLAIWPTRAFWILVKPLHLRSMLSKSMRCPENCNTCSQHWSVERAQCFCTTPDHVSHNQHFKSWTNLGYKFCLLCIFTWPLIYRLSLLQASWLFLQGKCIHNQQEAENAFQEFIKFRSMNVYASRINKLISPWRKCGYNSSYFE